MEIIGVVLAGGNSTRYSASTGKLKQFDNIIGKPLILNSLNILDNVSHKLIISTNSKYTKQLNKLIPKDMYVTIIEDSTDYSGPVNGIISTIEKIKGDVFLFIPVDMPIIPFSLIKRLLQFAMSAQISSVIDLNGTISTSLIVINMKQYPLETLKSYLKWKQNTNLKIRISDIFVISSKVHLIRVKQNPININYPSDISYIDEYSHNFIDFILIDNDYQFSLDNILYFLSKKSDSWVNTHIYKHILSDINKIKD